MAQQSDPHLPYYKELAQLQWQDWLVVGTALALTCSGWYFAHENIQQQNRVHYDFQASQILELVQERMSKYEEALWAGVAVLHTLPANASRSQWQNFASSLKIESRFPGIDGIGVIHFVPADQKDAFLERQRESMPSFKIHPSHSKNEYWPIAYIEPQNRNRNAVGLDMAHEKNRLEAAKKARDTGLSAITGPIFLVQEDTKTPGFLFYAPWYEKVSPTNKGTSHKGEEESLKFLGLVYSPFVVRRLMDGTLENSNRWVNFSIHDGSTELYNEFIPGSSNIDPNPMFTSEVSLDLYGRTWRFEVRSSALFRDQHKENESLLILLGGGLIDGLLFIFIVMARRYRRVSQYANDVAKDLKTQTHKLSYAHVRLQGAMDSMLDGLIVFDQDGKIIECNNAIESVLGYSKERLLTRQIKICLPEVSLVQNTAVKDLPSKYESQNTFDTKVLIGHKVSTYGVSADGREVPIELCVTLSQSFDDVFYTCIIHDLTAMRASESRTDEIDSLLTAAVYATQAGFAMLDLQHKVVKANSAMAAFLDYALSEIVGISIEKLFCPEDHKTVRDTFALMVGGHQDKWMGEYQFQRKNGSLLWGVMTAAIVRNTYGETHYLVLQVIDIQPRKKLAQDLEAQNAALEEAVKELDQFAFVASHDLKGPLRGLFQLCQWIEEDLAESLEPETAQYLRLMRNRTQRLDTLLEDLLDYSRVGRSDGEFKEIQFSDYVQDIFSMMSSSDTFSIEIDDAIGTFWTLATPLEMIIRNLIGNALKHHDKAEGLISVKGLVLKDGYSISITDDGPGILPDYQSSVFDMFHTLKPRDQVEGSGIGLSIIKKILDRYRCQFSLDSDGKCGTCFTFTWPFESKLRSYVKKQAAA